MGSLQAILPTSGPEEAYFPPEVADTIEAMRKLHSYMLFTVKAEVGEMVAGESSHITSLGNVPMIVISHGVPATAMGQTDEVNAQYEQVHQEMQIELLAQSTRSKQGIAERSSHDEIPVKQADLVMQSVLEVIRQATAME